MKKKILTVLAIVPAAPALAQYDVIAEEKLKTQVMLPGESVYLQVNPNVELQISHNIIAQQFLDRGINTTLQKIKVRVHEENNDIDFTSLDGHTLTVPLESLAFVPPNIDGRGD